MPLPVVVISESVRFPLANKTVLASGNAISTSLDSPITNWTDKPQNQLRCWRKPTKCIQFPWWVEWNIFYVMQRRIKTVTLSECQQKETSHWMLPFMRGLSILWCLLCWGVPGMWYPSTRRTCFHLPYSKQDPVEAMRRLCPCFHVLQNGVHGNVLWYFYKLSDYKRQALAVSVDIQWKIGSHTSDLTSEMKISLVIISNIWLLPLGYNMDKKKAWHNQSSSNVPENANGVQKAS